MVRIEGPLAWQQQKLFVADWYMVTGNDISNILTDIPKNVGNSLGVSVGTGPSEAPESASEIFQTLIASALSEIRIVTPYYVPNAPLQSMLCCAARSGIAVQIIFPKKNDSFIVDGASKSYYEDLLEAGVQIYEYPLGLLHSKIITIDGKLSYIGSTNLDRRSFDLNFEDNVFLYDEKITTEINLRQDDYLQSCEKIELSQVQKWSIPRKVWYNILAIVGPLL